MWCNMTRVEDWCQKKHLDIPHAGRIKKIYSKIAALYLWHICIICDLYCNVAYKLKVYWNKIIYFEKWFNTMYILFDNKRRIYIHLPNNHGNMILLKSNSSIASINVILYNNIATQVTWYMLKIDGVKKHLKLTQIMTENMIRNHP